MKSRTHYLLISIAGFIIVFYALPFYVLLTTAFKSMQDLSSKWIMPGYIYLNNFIKAWSNARLGNAFMNNTIITIISVSLIILFGAFASYPLARYKTKLNRVVYLVFISCMIVPPLTILVPLYKFYVQLGAMNSYWGIVLLHVTFQLPITIFLYTGFISTLPGELDEAAMIDGCSRFSIFFKILFPLLKPITATIVILTGVNIWNDYQFSVFFLQKAEVLTLTVSLSKFYGQFTNRISWVAAGSIISAMPIVFLYLFLQKYFIQGLSAGAVKG